jgi:hypothetical protein
MLGDIVDIRPKNCKKSKLRFMCAVQQHLNNTSDGHQLIVQGLTEKGIPGGQVRFFSVSK